MSISPSFVYLILWLFSGLIATTNYFTFFILADNNHNLFSFLFDKQNECFFIEKVCVRNNWKLGSK